MENKNTRGFPWIPTIVCGVFITVVGGIILKFIFGVTWSNLIAFISGIAKSIVTFSSNPVTFSLPIWVIFILVIIFMIFFIKFLQKFIERINSNSESSKFHPEWFQFKSYIFEEIEWHWDYESNGDMKKLNPFCPSCQSSILYSRSPYFPRTESWKCSNLSCHLNKRDFTWREPSIIEIKNTIKHKIISEEYKELIDPS